MTPEQEMEIIMAGADKEFDKMWFLHWLMSFDDERFKVIK